MSPTRPILLLTCILALAGCADPPGMRKPLPLDTREQFAASETYRRIGPELARQPGVVGTYLTQTNNPRRLVIIVRDEATMETIKKQYGRKIDDLRIRYEVANKGWDPNEGIEAVPTESLPTTWWDKVIFYFKNFANRVMPVDMPSEQPAPNLPPPRIDDKDLKAT